MSARRGGFTIVEVLVAVVILSVGVIALVGSSALVTRMMGRGKMTTLASQVASQRLERLRAYAAATNPRCTSAQFVSSTAAGADQGVTVSWTVPTSGATRTVVVYVTYKVPRGSRTDTVSTLISCIS